MRSTGEMQIFLWRFQAATWHLQQYSNISQQRHDKL
jgi:hypothetical protein